MTHITPFHPDDGYVTFPRARAYDHAFITIVTPPQAHTRRPKPQYTVSSDLVHTQIPRCLTSRPRYHLPRPAAYAEALSTEIAQFGIRVLIVQPGAHRTDVITSARNNILTQQEIEDYREMRERGFARYANQNGKQPGDAVKAMTAVADVVRGEGMAEGKPWPLWLVLGRDAEEDLRNHCVQKLGNLDEWLEVTRSTTVDDGNIVLI